MKMRAMKALEDMSREEFIEEVQRGLVVVGERQAEIDILRDENETLTKMFAVAQEDVHKLSEHAYDAGERAKVLEARVTHLEDENTGLVAENAAMKAELEKWQLLWEVANQGENQYAKQARELSLQNSRQRDRIDALEADIDDWKERCRQEIASKVQCQQSLTSVVEERDDLKEHIHRLEAELARSYANVKSVYERWMVDQKRLEKLQQQMYDLEDDNAALKERIARRN